MTENSYELLDDLFKDIKLRLARIRQSDPVAVDELKGLFTQLELWIDSLVVDSLKLRKLENMLHSTVEIAKGLRQRLEEGRISPRDKMVQDIAHLLDENVGPTTYRPPGKQD